MSDKNCENHLFEVMPPSILIIFGFKPSRSIDLSKSIEDSIKSLITDKTFLTNLVIISNIDNPNLNVRYWKGKNPVRIILDPHNKLIKNQKVLNDTISTLIYNIKHNKKTNNKYFVKTNPFKLDTIFSDLYKRGITSVLVEGGLSTINHILSNNYLILIVVYFNV